MRRFFTQSCLLPVLLFSLLGFLAMGYHPGAEDDAVYLSAVQARLNPSLYPHDSAFFLLQMRTSIFDTGMAELVRTTGLTVAWAELLIHVLSIVLLMFAAWKILCLMFEEAEARWGGVAMLAAMLTLPVAGTALYIADQYLHPRNPATALILLGVERVMRGKRWQAVPLLLLAFALHPLMGSLGVSFCFVLTLTFSEPVRNQVRSWRERFAPQPDETPEVATPVAAFFPFAWIFNKPSPGYLKAVTGRHNYYLFDWTWYEWLGAIGPLIIFWVVARVARKQGQLILSRFATAAFLYGAFQQVVAMILLNPKAPPTFYTLEPMRYLQLIYLFMTLVLGAYAGKYLLKASVWRWALFLLLANGGMAYAQRQIFPSSYHIELPGEAPANQWVQAFDWIRQNTPQDAYFAVDPYYMSAPGNDNHSFRALAERSALADAVKDPGIVTKAPELGAAWASQVQAASGWKHF